MIRIVVHPQYGRMRRYPIEYRRPEYGYRRHYGHYRYPRIRMHLVGMPYGFRRFPVLRTLPIGMPFGGPMPFGPFGGLPILPPMPMGPIPFGPYGMPFPMIGAGMLPLF